MSIVLVSIVIFIAMLLNSLMASLAGSCIPIILNRFRSDPAVGSGVLATTLTDIFGFFSFLGIASLGLKLIESNFQAFFNESQISDGLHW